MTADQVVALSQGKQPQAPQAQDDQASSPSGEASPAPGPTYTPVTGDTDTVELQHSKDWLAASRVMYRKNSGQDWQGSDEDLAQTGINSMGWFNYNLPAMGVDAAKLAQSSPEEKQAFLYLMETYDHLGMSWGGTWRLLKGAALDPTTYVGLGTFGLGAAAGQATKLASKQALKELLRVGIQTGIEGAAQAAAQNTIRQTVEKEVGARKDFSYGDLAKSTALGAGAGAVLGGAASAVGTVLRKEAPTLLRKEEPWSPNVRKEAREATNPAPTSEAPPTASEAPKAAGEAPSPAGAAEGKINPDGSVELPEVVVERGAEPKPVPVEEGKVPTPYKGELPAIPVKDEVVPQAHQEVMEAIKEMAKDSGARLFPRMGEETSAAADKATEIFTKIKPEDMPQVVEALRREAVTPEQQQLLHNAFKETGDRLTAETRDLYGQFSAATDQTVKEGLFKQLEAAKRVRDNVLEGDRALSSMDGRVLGDRVGSFNTAERRDLSEENLLAAKGIEWEHATPEQKAWAQDEYFKRYDEWANKAAHSQAVAEADQGITKAFADGDTALAIQLAGEKQAIVDAEAKRMMMDAGVVNQVKDRANKGLAYLNEYIISTVFTSSTLIVNVIPSFMKTIYRPALDFLIKGGPADYAAFRQMTTQYMVMAQSLPMALQAAKAAFVYEKALLSHEPHKLLEHEAAFSGFRGAARPVNDAGRLLRIFPRLLGATDEFFGQLNYRSFVMGEAVGNAVERGIKLGYRDEKLEAHVMQSAREAAEHKMFDKSINAPHVVGYLREQGLDRGYTGEKLNEWIKVQLDKNEALFKAAKSQAGKNYSDDLLFKRKFSGDNAPSRFAIGYEKFVNENPIMRPLGQMFFRTPVRVFEEGFRLTPGLNLLSPNMYKDLLGKNGPQRQVKAQGEMLLSYAISSWAVAQYAQGKLTSGGPSDYKTRRGLENAGDWQPNSYRAGKTSVSFRNLDPFSTPLKIIANVMDRLEDLRYRKAQGEFTEHQEKEALAWIGVAAGSIGSAISDANLTDGATQVVKLGQALMDPEHKDMTLSRFFASKAQLAVPNQINKVMMQGAPNMNDPTTIQQYLRARINPGDPKVPRQYDVLGNVRTVANPTGALLGVQWATDKQMERGHSPKELAVLKAVSNLEIASGQSFGVMPAKVNDYGLKGQDLRSVYAKDGRTYYDKLQAIYKGLPVTNQLWAALVANQGGTVGTREHVGTRVELAKSIIKDMRDIALVKLLSQESGLREDYIKSLKAEQAAISGKKDVDFLPYR